MDKITSVSIEFKTENAAFEYDARPEISRILRELANKFDNAGVYELDGETVVKDVNGNTVGCMWVEVESSGEDEEE